MDDVLPMVNNMKAHIARAEAELAQARETIATMAALGLEREKEVARLREALKPFSYLAEVMDDGNMLNFRGVYVSTEQAQVAADALKETDHDPD